MPHTGIGLSENEERVYKALLRLKAATGQDIAELSEVPKSTAYDALRSLSKKSLVNIYKKKGRKYFSVNDPSLLRALASERVQAVEEVLPSMLKLYQAGDTSIHTKLYSGADGLKEVLDSILREAKVLYAVGAPEELFNKLPDVFPAFTRARARAKIRLVSIFRDSRTARERHARDSEDMRESKLIETEKSFSSLMYVWNKKVALITFDDVVQVVVLEHKELSLLLEMLLVSLWKKS